MNEHTERKTVGGSHPPKGHRWLCLRQIAAVKASPVSGGLPSAGSGLRIRIRIRIRTATCMHPNALKMSHQTATAVATKATCASLPHGSPHAGSHPFWSFLCGTITFFPAPPFSTFMADQRLVHSFQTLWPKVIERKYETAGLTPNSADIDQSRWHFHIPSYQPPATIHFH